MENRIVSEDIPGVESELARVANSLLKFRPDLANRNRLRLFEKILEREVAALNSAEEAMGRKVPSSVREQPRSSPPGKFMRFVLELNCGVLPAALIAATFPQVPLLILPVVVLIGFFASRYLSWADPAGKHRLERDPPPPGR